MTDHTTPSVIGGRYEPVRPIGRGGMGVVWLARDTVLGRSVAAKQIGDFPGESQGEADRAMREARAAAALNHPNVVAVYDVVEHEDSPWLVMEYVAGPTLATAIRQRGPMTAKGAADLGAQLAGALAAAHRAGVVHRDIKPGNVLIGGGLPKLGDFGIARAGGTDEQTPQAGLVTGTPNYMAPEVAVGRPHGEAADVWALGATIYFAVEGHDAYPSRSSALATLQDVASQPPRRPERAGPLEPVLADMLARDPARRGTMREALRRLESIAAGGADIPPTTRTAAGVPPSGARATPPAAAAGAAPDSDRRAKGVGPLLLWLLLGVLAVALIVWGILFLTRGGTAADSSGAAVSGQEQTVMPSASGAATGATSSTSSEPTSATSTGELDLTEEEATEFIEDYFTTVTKDRDAAWAMLAPERHDDRAGYDEFWSGYKKVDATDISVDTEAGTVSTTLELKPEDGEELTRRYTYELIRIDGDLRIAAND
ncbi:serine/threonine-protein kinase [Janibacter sp. DB-40]|uniref:serine/threonine-protein kinase n=1 Tax=Janibacter sp. DB-40 TaxID=3028808 RepID=UPI00240632A3|nr:serine/threonine-protein kinase [Janibacter sp. DB-40]